MTDLHCSNAAQGGCLLVVLLLAISFMVGVLVGWLVGGC